MTQNFVRHSPGVERDDPKFEQSLQAVLEGMKQRVRPRSWQMDRPRGRLCKGSALPLE